MVKSLPPGLGFMSMTLLRSAARLAFRRHLTGTLRTPVSSSNWHSLLAQNSASVKPCISPVDQCKGFTHHRRDFSTSARIIKKRRKLQKVQETKNKIKSYTSYKGRFWLLPDGNYMRYRAGKNHNAHSKTPKRRRQLRQPTIVSPGFSKIMRKLGFKGKWTPRSKKN